MKARPQEQRVRNTHTNSVKGGDLAERGLDLLLVHHAEERAHGFVSGAERLFGKPLELEGGLADGLHGAVKVHPVVGLEDVLPHPEAEFQGPRRVAPLLQAPGGGLHGRQQPVAPGSKTD